MDSFETMTFERELYDRLKEAELEAELTDRRFTSKEVLEAMKKAINRESS